MAFSLRALLLPLRTGKGVQIRFWSALESQESPGRLVVTDSTLPPRALIQCWEERCEHLHSDKSLEDQDAQAITQGLVFRITKLKARQTPLGV